MTDTATAAASRADQEHSRWPRLPIAFRRDATTPVPPVYRRHQYAAIAVFLVLVGLIAPALAQSRAGHNLVDLWLVYSIAGVGFYWIFGLAGRFAFCQTFMMVLGAYTSAWITRAGDGQPMWLGLLGAMLVAAALAVLIGLILHRASDLYFAIATLSVTQVGTVVFQQWEGFAGPNGTVTGIKPLSLFGYQFITDEQAFWLFLGALGLTLLLAAFIERSPLRRLAIAARDRPMVARVLGVPVIRVQIMMFALGSAFGALSGALIGHWNGLVSVDSFGLTLAIGLFLMLILGGAASPWGPVIGAAFYVWIPEVLTGLEGWQQVVYGAVLLITIVVLPDGLVGVGSHVRRLLFGGRPTAESRANVVRRLRRLRPERTRDDA